MMANDWFRFKQFMIRQDQCAMKVGTDGVILGAWTAVGVDGKLPGETGPSAANQLSFAGEQEHPADHRLPPVAESACISEEPGIHRGMSRLKAGKVTRALDIGTGTGLLALMLAQRLEYLEIDAIELDPAAAEQAAANVAASDFADRIRVQQADFREFHPGGVVLYDLVICNPPYFSHSQKAAGASRRLARHSDTLELETLFGGTVRVLSQAGSLSIIIPSDQFSGAKALAGMHGLFPARILEVRPVPGAPPRRHCIQFTRAHVTPAVQSIVIEEHGRHGYSADYRELTKTFYLDL